MPDTRDPDVAGLVLAAGASSRMPGGSKLLCSWRDGTVIGSVLDSARRAGLVPIGVVVDPRAGELLPHLDAAGAWRIPHPEWRRGRASTLAAGLDALASATDAVAAVILLGDEPEVSAPVIRAVIAGWRGSGCGMARARYRDRPGHPVLLARDSWPRAVELRGETSVWNRLEAAGLPVREIPVDQLAPIDVDDPASLAAARARLAGIPVPKPSSEFGTGT
jgi:nicotine blue oxidoreductase